MFLKNRISSCLLRLMFLAQVLITFSSCSSLFVTQDAEPSRIKLPSKEAVIKEIQVSRADLNNALGNELMTSKIRAVEIFQNSSGYSQGFTNFRLFEISEGSVYELLGLSNADILVAINERAVVTPQVISQVVRLLPNEKGVTFEIIREGKSILLKLKFY